jgi:hypothetical protein
MLQGPMLQGQLLQAQLSQLRCRSRRQARLRLLYSQPQALGHPVRQQQAQAPP